jgi:uncharacterized protein HemX
MDPESSRFALFTRRARSTAVVLAIGALGVGFSACGDDEESNINDQIDEAQEQLGTALDDVDTEKLQQQAEDAQEQIESALSDVDTEELQQQAEEAQKQLEELQQQNGN